MAMLADNDKMDAAKTEIEEAAGKFAEMGTAFIEALNNALRSFEGETKDILVNNKIGVSGSQVEGTLAFFVEKQVPELLKGLSQLLEGNRATIAETDQKLADAISGGGQG